MAAEQLSAGLDRPLVPFGSTLVNLVLLADLTASLLNPPTSNNIQQLLSRLSLGFFFFNGATLAVFQFSSKEVDFSDKLHFSVRRLTNFTVL